MVRAEFPASLEFDVRFWRYTPRDLLRIAVPAITGWLILDIFGFITGTVLGIIAAEVTIEGSHLDEYVLQFSSFLLDRTQSSWPEIERLADSAVVLDNGTVLGFVKASSVDLDLVSDTEQSASRATVHDLLKKIDYTVQIHSVQRLQDLSNFEGVTGSTIVTDHIIAIQVPPDYSDTETTNRAARDSTEGQVKELEDRCKEVRQTLTGGDLHAETVTGDELKNTLKKLYFRPSDTTRKYFRVKTRTSESSKLFHRLLYVSEYPESLPVGWLADVLTFETPGMVNTVQVLEPVSEKQLTWISRTIGRIKAEIAATNDPWHLEQLVRKRDDAEDLLQAIATSNEVLLNYSTYIICRGNTEKEVEATVDAVSSVLRQHQVSFKEPVFQGVKAAKTESVLFPDYLEKSLITPGRAAASGFSFSTQDQVDEDGVIYGADTRNGSPIALNRFSWEAGHIARMGKIGSGKSYAAKLTLLREIKQNSGLQVRILDPKQEYGVIGDTVGGSRVNLDKKNLDRIDESHDIVRYTVEDRSKDNTDVLTEAVRHIYNNASQDTDETVVLIDEAHRLLRDPDGRTALGELVREGRDRNVAVELVTQNASDFTQSQEGRDILKNINCYIFMRHQDVDTSVSNFFNLSEREAIELRRLRTGTDLSYSEAIIRGPVNTKLRIESQPREHQIIEKTGG